MTLEQQRLRRFMLIVRQACLMIAAFVERETGVRGTATNKLDPAIRDALVGLDAEDEPLTR